MSEVEWLLVPISQKTKRDTLERMVGQIEAEGFMVNGPRRTKKDLAAIIKAARQVEWGERRNAAIRKHDRELRLAEEAEVRVQKRMQKMMLRYIQKARSNAKPFEGITATEADAFIATLPMPEGIK